MQIAPPMVSVLIGPLILVIAPVTQGAGGGVISLIVISTPLPVGLVRLGYTLLSEGIQQLKKRVRRLDSVSLIVGRKN